MNPEAVDALRSGANDPIDADGRVPHGSSDDPSLLDFSANVNPNVPDGAEAVYRDAFDDARSYPPDDYPNFRQEAASYAGCELSDVVPTAGGLAAIRLVMQTAVDVGDSVLVPVPSFGEYAREVRLQGAEPAFVPHDELLDASLDDHAVAIVCNPNNPTGEAVDPDTLQAFATRCRDVDTTLLVDEAFLGFTDHPSLAGEDGVVVARSLTKLFGLPGLRAGFAVATGDHRARIETAAMPWSVGTPAAVTGAYCMRQESFVAETRSRVERERARLRGRLESQYSVSPSDAPFLLLDCGPSKAVDELLARVDDHGVAVRDARTFRGLDSHVRIAVRLPDENDRLLEAIGV